MGMEMGRLADDSFGDFRRVGKVRFMVFGMHTICCRGVMYRVNTSTPVILLAGFAVRYHWGVWGIVWRRGVSSSSLLRAAESSSFWNGRMEQWGFSVCLSLRVSWF